MYIKYNESYENKMANGNDWVVNKAESKKYKKKKKKKQQNYEYII